VKINFLGIVRHFFEFVGSGWRLLLNTFIFIERLDSDLVDLPGEIAAYSASIGVIFKILKLCISLFLLFVLLHLLYLRKQGLFPLPAPLHRDLVICIH
jgi:hypothetical protein